MKKLVVLRGNIGSGKSTFIKNNNLEMYTLSPDTIRLMFNSPEMTINYSEMIPQYNNKKVWDLLYEILEERMKKGEFTIIDALHAKREDYTTYKKLAEKYRYRTYVVDFSNVDINEIYKRNEEREEYKSVPKYAIDRIDKCLKEGVPSSFKVVLPEEFNSIVEFRSINVDKYEKIHVIGDIHACFDTINDYISNNEIKSNELYIFTGDYFDKGLQNIDTFNLLNKLIDLDNTIFLIGNHEEKLYKYACDDFYRNDYDIQTTINEIVDKIKKSEIRGFYKKLSQCSFIEFGGNKYLITHGGIPFIPNKYLTYYSSNTFIYGIDNYDTDIDKLYNDFMLNSENKIIQIHGHRNYFKYDFDEFDYSINLDGNVENGGTLRVLTINKDGSKSMELFKNDNYDPKLLMREYSFELINELRNSKYIFEKELNNNISSFNFSNEAFYNKVWNNITTHARGLFIDTKNYDIVIRSYDKFFNIDENYMSSLDNIKKTIVFPVHFYKKYNGFLGLLSVYNNELYFATKSSDSGEYLDYFKNVFYEIYNEDQINNIKNRLIKNNTTFLFEVIDSINDKHIIKYDHNNLILLDEVYREKEFNKVNYLELSKFAKENNMFIKEELYTCKTIEEFDKLINEIREEDYKYNNEYIEGFVIEDNNHFQFKYKTEYYKKWKNIRTKIETSIRNNSIDIKGKSDFEKDFFKFLKDKYSEKVIDLNSINIIDEREDYYNN